MVKLLLLMIMIHGFVAEDDFSLGKVREKRQAPNPPFKPGYTYFPDIDGWLKFHHMSLPAVEARSSCHVEGSVLASPITHDLSKAMVEMMTSKGASHWIHTGINSLLTEKLFMSIEGVPIWNMPLRWMSGEPNGQGVQHCVTMYSTGEMADADCGHPLSFLCYKKNFMVNYDKCGVDYGYNLDEKSGKCYKFHDRALQWHEALRICYGEESLLGIINSRDEDYLFRYMMSLFAEQTGKGYRDSMFLGFHNMYMDGWVTLEGGSLEDAGFNRWGPNQPSNSYPGELCGSMFRTGELNDASCNFPLPFICEKKQFPLPN